MSGMYILTPAECYEKAERLHQKMYEAHMHEMNRPWTVTLHGQRERERLMERYERMFGVPGSVEAEEYIERVLYPEQLKLYGTPPPPPPKVYKPVRYLLTFTVDPKNNIDFLKFQWWCMKEAEKAIFLTVKMAYEHVNTNMHCHMDALCKKPISFGPKGNFASYERNVGIILHRGPIKKDNGIQTYLDKEAEEILSIDNTHENPQWLTQKVVRALPPIVEGAPLVAP